MTVEERNFFHIQKELLEGNTLFPFHLFVYNPKSKKYSAFLYANSPLTTEKNQFLDFVEKKNGKIAIDIKQKRTFQHFLDLTDEELKANNKVEFPKSPQVHGLEKEAQKAKNEKEIQDNESPLILNQEIKKAQELGDFSHLIERAKIEIQSFSPKICHTVSLARYLATHLLIDDSIHNRIVALSYFLAKRCDFTDEKDLGDLVVASFLANLGMTQQDLGLRHKAYKDYSPTQTKEFHQKPGLGQHLIKRVKLEVSDDCLSILLQHHERASGLGKPEGKTIHQVHPLSMALGAISHAVAYSEGHITGQKESLVQVLRKMASKAESSGLESDFGDKILEGMKGFIPRDQPDDKDNDPINDIQNAA